MDDDELRLTHAWVKRQPHLQATVSAGTTWSSWSSSAKESGSSEHGTHETVKVRFKVRFWPESDRQGILSDKMTKTF